MPVKAYYLHLYLWSSVFIFVVEETFSNYIYRILFIVFIFYVLSMIRAINTNDPDLQKWDMYISTCRTVVLLWSCNIYSLSVAFNMVSFILMHLFVHKIRSSVTRLSVFCFLNRIWIGCPFKFRNAFEYRTNRTLNFKLLYQYMN